MRIIAVIWYVLLAASMLIIAGCGEDEEGEEVGKPPTVKNVMAAGGTSAAATNGSIIIAFSGVIDPATVQGAVTFNPPVQGVATYDEKTRMLTFDPKSDLQAYTTYSVTVSGVSDKVGNEMESYTFSLVTAEKDAQPPTIVMTTPAHGEAEASTDARFIIEFSEPMDQAKFGQDLSLTPDTGIPPTQWSFTWSEDGKQVEIFIPVERKKLDGMTDYALSIGASSVVDLVGNSMESSAEIKFTTTGSLRIMEGLVIYYSFDEDTVAGGEVKDVSENGNDGIIKGNLELEDGVVNEGMKFPGAATSYIAVKQHHYNAADIEGITLAAWIKTSTLGMIASWDRSEFFRFGAGDDQLGNTTFISWDTCCGIHDWHGTIEVTDGDWHHVAATYDSQAAGEKRIYVDGELDDSTNAHGGAPMGKAVTRYGFIGVGSEAAAVDGGTGPTWAFNGIIDEFVLYDRALSEDEIKDLFGVKGLAGAAPARKLGQTWGAVKAQY